MMKKLLILLIILSLCISLNGCKDAIKESEMSQCFDGFFEAMKSYDREGMSRYLTSFPNNAPYVYYDDIFNDEAYVEMYRLLYKDISYEVVSTKGGKLTFDVQMPDVQNLYTNMLNLVFQMSLEDVNLSGKLSENDENGSLLVQEMMLAYVRQGYEVPLINKRVTLTFEKDDQILICCDDELRALITGNFFLSKSNKINEIKE